MTPFLDLAPAEAEITPGVCAMLVPPRVVAGALQAKLSERLGEGLGAHYGKLVRVIDLAPPGKLSDGSWLCRWYIQPVDGDIWLSPTQKMGMAPDLCLLPLAGVFGRLVKR